MEGISDIKISGVDEKRPPILNKAPYIDLFFKLIHQAPKDWCTDFNLLASNVKCPAKITPEAGLFIETWVRKPDEIVKALEDLKIIVTTCNDEYIARINAATAAANKAGDTPSDEGPQGQLNKIVAELDFE